MDNKEKTYEKEDRFINELTEEELDSLCTSLTEEFKEELK